jgi:hypothetical protein
VWCKVEEAFYNQKQKCKEKEIMSFIWELEWKMYIQKWKVLEEKTEICNKEIKKKPPCWVKWNYNIFLERVKVLSKS